MPLTGEYEPSTSAWARNQAEKFEATGGAAADRDGARRLVEHEVGLDRGRGHEDAWAIGKVIERVPRAERPHPRVARDELLHLRDGARIVDGLRAEGVRAGPGAFHAP